MTTIEVWVVVDADGNYETGTSEEVALEAFENNVGDAGELVTRKIKLALQVELPKVVELTGTVPATGEGAILKVA